MRLNQAPAAHPIVAFYDPDIQAPFDPSDPDTTLEDVLQWPDSVLESRHDYIQHLFPLPERSPNNPSAPLLNPHVRGAFLEDEYLQDNLLRAYKRMMAFFGWDVEDMPYKHEIQPGLTPRSNFRAAADRTWLQPFNHNQLRITRIIRCLRILGLPFEAQAMCARLVDGHEAAQGIINRKTITLWVDASARPICFPPDYPDVPICDWLLIAGESSPRSTRGGADTVTPST